MDLSKVNQLGNLQKLADFLQVPVVLLVVEAEYLGYKVRQLRSLNIPILYEDLEVCKKFAKQMIEKCVVEEFHV